MSVLVETKDNHVITNSLKVAKKFEKDHSRILKDVRKLIKELNEGKIDLVNSYVKETSYKDLKSETRPMFEFNRDFFTLLVMGFTGTKALKFKRAYIKRFNEMEQQLHNQKQICIQFDDNTIHNFYLSSPQYFIQPYFRWKRHNTQYLCCINDIIKLTDFDTDRNIASAINDFCKITGSKLNNTDIIEGQLTFFTDFSYIRDFLYTKKNTKYTVLKYNIERNFKKEIEKYTIQNDVDEVKEISNTNNKYITNECISLSERLKSATECAKLLNITPCKFGRITNKLNLKTPEYGGYFKEVLSNNREVQTFKYKEKILDVVKNYLYN